MFTRGISMNSSEEFIVKIKPKISRKIKKYLALREFLKSKKPNFIRMDSWAKPSLADSSWRRPKGLDNKIRLERKGFPKKVKIGYRGPKIVRNLHPSGFKEVLVYNPSDLDKINPDIEAIRIASTVGKRKRSEILEKAKEIGIKVLNPGVEHE